MRISLKKWVLFCVVGAFAVILTSCSSAKAQNNTPMGAAKAFVQGMIDGSPNEISKVTYTSKSIPPKDIAQIAKNREFSKMKLDQFHFQKDSKDKDTIIVTFKDEDGHQDKWDLVFIKDKIGYQYRGDLSSSFVKNGTPLEAAQTFMRGLLKNDPASLEQLATSHPQEQQKNG